MAQRRLDAIAYTVVWICALPVELAAARVMFDEEHLLHDSIDSAQYILGRIGSHNVVLVCLSDGQAKARFTSIDFGLMVGVGGGVPSAEADVRLGHQPAAPPARWYGAV